MKKIAITQPNYLPWLGYFELLDQVDLWVVLDNVQLGNRSFVQRNKIALNNKEVWVSVSLEKKKQDSFINDVHLKKGDWWKDHLNKMKNYYRHSKYYSETLRFMERIIPPQEDFLSEYNLRIILSICDLLQIPISFKKSSEIISNKGINAENRILEICASENADNFYNFKKGVEIGLYDAKKFKSRGILMYKQDYLHPTYTRGSNDFIQYLSIVDLLFYHYKSSIDIIKSGRNWILVE